MPPTYQQAAPHLAWLQVLMRLTALLMSMQAGIAQLAALLQGGERRERATNGSWWEDTVPEMHDQQFAETFRMPPTQFEGLVQRLSHEWSGRPIASLGKHSRDIPCDLATAIFLMRLGTQNSLQTIADQFGVARSTACEVTATVAQLVCKRLHGLIAMPRNELEWREVARRWNQRSCVHNVVGAIDGTLIPISKPFSSAEESAPL
jgi:hypothetical protein